MSHSFWRSGVWDQASFEILRQDLLRSETSYMRLWSENFTGYDRPAPKLTSLAVDERVQVLNTWMSA